MINNEENNEQQISIELTEEMATGSYTNLAIISHSPTEFVFDFIQMMPGAPKAKVRSRVLMHPMHAKRLLMALNENIQKFEEQLGEIDINQGAVPVNFGPTGMA